MHSIFVYDICSYAYIECFCSSHPTLVSSVFSGMMSCSVALDLAEMFAEHGLSWQVQNNARYLWHPVTIRSFGFHNSSLILLRGWLETEAALSLRAGPLVSDSLIPQPFLFMMSVHNGLRLGHFVMVVLSPDKKKYKNLIEMDRTIEPGTPGVTVLSMVIPVWVFESPVLIRGETWPSVVA